MMPEESSLLSDIRNNRLRSAETTAHRTPLSCFRLAQNTNITKHCSTYCCYTKHMRRNVLRVFCMSGETCGQWAAKSPWMLQLHNFTEIVKKAIYWPIYKPYLLSLTYCYSLFAKPDSLDLSYGGVISVASFMGGKPAYNKSVWSRW